MQASNSWLLPPEGTHSAAPPPFVAAAPASDGLGPQIETENSQAPQVIDAKTKRRITNTAMRSPMTSLSSSKATAAEALTLLHHEVERSSSDKPLAMPLQEVGLMGELLIQEHLGSGGQADVYKAIWWRKFGKSTSALTVALKHFRVSATSILRESEFFAKNIRHPNLVRCFEATMGVPHLIISEYCSGGSLNNVLLDDAIQLPWRNRLKVLLDVSKALEHLHSREPVIIHRDLKSCNVLLAKPLRHPAQTPVAKVADFGLSRIVAKSEEFMTTCVGTWRWMAPEVFSSNAYDERVDVFSFAILMFEVLSRQIPYADKWPASNGVNPRIGLYILKGNRPTLELVQKGCPAMLKQLMETCWATEPSDRPDFISIVKKLTYQSQLVNLYGTVMPDAGYT